MTLIEREQKYTAIAGHFEREKQTTLALLLLNNLKTKLHLTSGKVNEIPVDQNIKHLTDVAEEVLNDWRTEQNCSITERVFYSQLGVTLIPVVVDNGQYQAHDLNIVPNEAFLQLLEGKAPIRLFNPTDEELEVHWSQYQQATTLL